MFQSRINIDSPLAISERNVARNTSISIMILKSCMIITKCVNSWTLSSSPSSSPLPTLSPPLRFHFHLPVLETRHLAPAWSNTSSDTVATINHSLKSSLPSCHTPDHGEIRLSTSSDTHPRTTSDLPCHHQESHEVPMPLCGLFYALVLASYESLTTHSYSARWAIRSV